MIDINKLPVQMLLEKGTMFAYVMLMEKSKDKKELANHLNQIIQSTKDTKKLEELANIISYLLKNVLEENEQEEMLEKIDQKVGEKNMSTLYDRLVDENRRILKEGKKIGEEIGEKRGKEIGERKSQRQIAKNMIHKKLEDEIILEVTGIKKEELEEIKNKLAMVG